MTVTKEGLGEACPPEAGEDLSTQEKKATLGYSSRAFCQAAPRRVPLDGVGGDKLCEFLLPSFKRPLPKLVVYQIVAPLYA